jgi:hypothetical protein
MISSVLTGFTLLSPSLRDNRSGTLTHAREYVFARDYSAFLLDSLLYDSIQLQPRPTRMKVVAQDLGNVELVSRPPLARKASYRHVLMRAHTHN